MHNFLKLRSKFFVDISNVLFYTDIFLYHELTKRMEKDPSLRLYFGDTINGIKSSLEEINSKDIDKSLVHITACKLSQNILRDWINIDAFNEINSEELLEPYLANLYKEFLTNPVCDEYLQMTEYGNVLGLLSTDSNFSSITIYMPFYSDFIVQNIKEVLPSTLITKTSFAYGNKKEILATHTSFNSYTFENVRDIDLYLTANKYGNVDVIIPRYEYNLKPDRGDFMKMVEDVSISSATLNLNKPFNYYTEYHGLLINTLPIPI